MSAIELWRRGQRGWPRRFPIVQAPNAPLLVSLAASRVASLGGGRTRESARLVSTLGLGVWAWGETTAGANWLRRLLGVAGLASAALALARQFRAIRS